MSPEELEAWPAATARATCEHNARQTLGSLSNRKFAEGSLAKLVKLQREYVLLEEASLSNKLFQQVRMNFQRLLNATM